MNNIANQCGSDNNRQCKTVCIAKGDVDVEVGVDTLHAICMKGWFFVRVHRRVVGHFASVVEGLA